MIGVFTVTTEGLRERTRHECVQELIYHTEDEDLLLVVNNAGGPKFTSKLVNKYPKALILTVPGPAPGNLTHCWNKAFEYLFARGCDAVFQLNHDVIVNYTWPFMKLAMDIYSRELAMFGPLSNNPGVDYTGRQTAGMADSSETLQVELFTGSKYKGRLFYCCNGFCFGINRMTYEAVTKEFGSLMDEKKHPWGGQEEQLGNRIHELGGRVGIVKNCWVYHHKYQDWRGIPKELRKP